MSMVVEVESMEACYANCYTDNVLQQRAVYNMYKLFGNRKAPTSSV